MRSSAEVDPLFSPRYSFPFLMNPKPFPTTFLFCYYCSRLLLRFVLDACLVNPLPLSCFFLKLYIGWQGLFKGLVFIWLGLRRLPPSFGAYPPNRQLPSLPFELLSKRGFCCRLDKTSSHVSETANPPTPTHHTPPFCFLFGFIAITVALGYPGGRHPS